MITARAFAGKKYAVLGLARSGAATVEALLASGAQVVAWDERKEARETLLSHPGEGRDPGTPDSESMGSGFRRNDSLTFADPLTLDLTGFAGVIVSPGVPLNRHPIAPHARNFGVPVIGDIELFAQARAELPPHKVVGITGTNGKSTTTALVHHILKIAGVPTTMGGNIGLPILAQDPLPEGGVYVLELSSYQIDLTYSLDCDVAVLLNITPDHLDRYENFAAYAASKMRLFDMQSMENEEDGRVVVVEDPEARRLSQSIWVTEKVDLARLRRADQGFVSPQEQWPSLQGPHNALNASAAISVARLLDVDWIPINQGLRSFSGLPHRMERIREREGVLFVNDSKATNPDSTAPALAAYPYIHWIVGGLAKTDTLGPCEQHLDHIRAAYTIGEAGPMFARLLDGKVPVTQSQKLERAVTDAAGAATAGEVVLLSPACASFDQFKDYEARGAAFRAAVEALP
jgi:UDP-N-acetylmuramoylalanine--D-glutamate ligase